MKIWLIKNRKLITLIVSILAIILGGSKYYFSYKKVDNITENNIRSENQTGGIIGNNVNVYQQSPDSNNFDISTLPSAFDFLDKLRKFDTSIEISDYLKTIHGTEVGGIGYISNIGYSGLSNSTNGYFVVLDKSKEISSFIICYTNEKNAKLAILKKESVPPLIKFKGQIDNGSSLNNCEFQ